MQDVVQARDIAPFETPFTTDDVSGHDHHVVHRPEDTRAARPGQGDLPVVDVAQGVDGKSLALEGSKDLAVDVPADRSQQPDGDVQCQAGEERALVYQKYAFLALDVA